MNQLWFSNPAIKWEDALPIGNGRLGAMIFGGIDKERLQLNDITLWSGKPQSDIDREDAYIYLPLVRQLINEKQYAKAQNLINEHFTNKGGGFDAAYSSSYQTLGDLTVERRILGEITSYIRFLDIDNAVAGVKFTCNDIIYTTEYFSSATDDVIICRFTASKQGTINLRFSLSRENAEEVYILGSDTVLMKGRASCKVDDMIYETEAKAVAEGGIITASGTYVSVSDADSLTIYIAAGTDYISDPSKGYKTCDPHSKICKTVELAITKSFNNARLSHITEYKSFYERLSLEIDGLSNCDLPTDLRLIRYNQGEEDIGLVILFYQFGRYLLISSSRPSNPLPANLQGLWADGLDTPWHGDYHTNINVQMNYWPAGQTNLSDCNIPLVNLIKTLVKPGRKTAKAYYDAEGWTVYTITNVWGWTSPGWESAWAQFPCAGAWMCQHLFEHYAYTQDIEYLNDIYPVLKENCIFNMSILVEDDDSTLITNPSTSPENNFKDNDGNQGWVCKGNSVDRQIIFDNFDRMINVCEILDKDRGFKEKLIELKDRIKKPQIGKAGQLLEWYGDWDLNAPEPQHRHVSHMFALHPGTQITPENTPELAQACKKSLEMRGDSGTGWSKAWKINFWARLHDGNHAYKLLREQLNYVNNTDYNYTNGGGVYSNLFDAHPPFQIDGNFGATAGITEMFLQSHIMDEYGVYIINLLPALPDLFKNGGIKGIAARGNFIVNIDWQNNSLFSAEIISKSGGICKVRAHKNVAVLSNGKPVSIEKADDIICFTTEKNNVYTLI